MVRAFGQSDSRTPPEVILGGLASALGASIFNHVPLNHHQMSPEHPERSPDSIRFLKELKRIVERSTY